MVQPLWKTVWRVLRTLKIELPFDPALPLLGIYLEKTMTRKDTCIPMLIAALFTIAKTWNKVTFLMSDTVFICSGCHNKMPHTG